MGTDKDGAPDLGAVPEPEPVLVPVSGAALDAAMLDRLEQLGTTLDTVAQRIEAVASRERKTRLLAFGMLGSFVLDIALTIIVTILSVNALSQASTIHQSQLAACAISNQARAQQIQLWEFLFQLAGPKAANNPEDQKLLAFVRETFQPVNCASVYHR